MTWDELDKITTERLSAQSYVQLNSQETLNPPRVCMDILRVSSLISFHKLCMNI